MKVVWICHFSNEEIQKLIPLFFKIREFAPWIPNLIKGFEALKDIELNIISPHYFIKKPTNLCIRGVNYYFLPTGFPIFHGYYPSFLPINSIFNFYLFNKRVKKIIDFIKPDIINLHGVENAHYSYSIMQIKNKYPIIISIQGFISEIANKNSSCNIKRAAKNEIEILKNFNYYLGDHNSKEYIQKFNKNINFFVAYYPTNEELIMKLNQTDYNKKIYDCIYFGRLNDINKGTLEFVKVINEVKKTIPDIKGVMIGPGRFDYINQIIKDLDCTKNIEILKFAKNQEELFKIVKKSKIVLIPSLFDRLPSTIRESMLLKVPIIAYSVGSIPSINNDSKNIELIEKGNFKKMAETVINLLNNNEYYEKLKNSAYEYALKEFSLSVNVKRIIDAYNLTIKEFYQ